MLLLSPRAVRAMACVDHSLSENLKILLDY